jgi:hypothetical protein
VLAVEDGKAVLRSVTIGSRGEASIEGRTESAAEITSGLQAGALVLRGSVGALRAGTQLTLAPAAAATAASGASSSLP